TRPDAPQTARLWDGMQPYIDFDGTPSWEEWKAERDKRIKRPPTGILLATEANDKYARAVGDLTGSCPPGCSWLRELVFLDYKYLIVADRVRTSPDIDHRWTLHTVNEPKLSGPLVVADNLPGRLFCKTLLPANARLALVGGEGHEFDYNGTNRPPKGFKGLDKEPRERQYGGWRVDVTPNGGATEVFYVHVLFPTDGGTDTMPECSAVQKDGDTIVKIGPLTHLLKSVGAR
ncbi:MAG: hypothetical protein N2255_04770, partial [Kiritimatiellae bacterium]|nr:hypothetical protein [Kiritimatiellia bacterium]